MMRCMSTPAGRFTNGLYEGMEIKMGKWKTKWKKWKIIFQFAFSETLKRSINTG